MNDIKTLVDDVETMTSLEIATVTGKPHNDVMKAIRKMEPAWKKINGGNFSLVEYQDKKGESRPCYSLTKTECLYIATKFNDEARAKLVLKWEELEKKERKQFNIPASYSEALMLAAKQAEQIEEQQKQLAAAATANLELGNKITEMLPKVSYYDQILQSNATMTVTQIAQDYGMSARKFNAILAEMKIQHKMRDQWILYGQFLTGGYVHSRAVDIVRTDGRHDVKYNTEWTTKGRIFLYKSLKKKGILPLIEQETTDKKQEKIQPIQQTMNFT